MAGTRGDGPSKPLDADKIEPASIGVGVALLDMHDGEFGSDEAAETLREKRTQSGTDDSYMTHSATPSEAENARKKEEDDARDWNYSLIATLAMNDAVFDSMLDDLDNMAKAGQQEGQQQGEDVMDLEQQYKAVMADIAATEASLNARGKPTLTLDDIKGIDKKALGIDGAANRVIYTDPKVKNKFYTVDEKGERHMIADEDAKKIADYIAKHPGGKRPGSEKDPEQVTQNLNFIKAEKIQFDARQHAAEEAFATAFLPSIIAKTEKKLQEIGDSSLSPEEKRKQATEIMKERDQAIIEARATLGLPAKELHHHHGGSKDENHEHDHDEDQEDANSTQSTDHAAPAPPQVSMEMNARTEATLAGAIVQKGQPLNQEELETIAVEMGVSVDYLEKLEQELAVKDYAVAQAMEKDTPEEEQEHTLSAESIEHEIGSFIQGISQAALDPDATNQLSQGIVSSFNSLAATPAAPAPSTRLGFSGPSGGRKT